MSATRAVLSSGNIAPSQGDAVRLTISNIKYAISGTPKRKQKYYVKFFVGEYSKKTKSLRQSKEGVVLWNEIFPIAGTTGTVLILKVCRNSTIGWDKHVVEGHTILSHSIKEGVVTLGLTTTSSNKRQPSPVRTIQFTITALTFGNGRSTTVNQPQDVIAPTDVVIRHRNAQSLQLSSADQSTGAPWGPDVVSPQPIVITQPTDSCGAAVPQALEAVKHMHAKAISPQSSSDSTVNGLESTGGDIGTILQSLLGHMSTFMVVMDKLSEIHPYVKLAWSILSAVQRVVENREGVDTSVTELAQQMDDTYKLVIVAEDLDKAGENKNQKDVLELMAKQMVECAYFIQSYASLSQLKRTFKSLGPQAKDKIAEYTTTFARLREAFVAQTAVHIQLSVARILQIAGDLKGDLDLNDMPYAASAGFDPAKKCLDGTRVEIVDEIFLWASSTEDNGKNVLLLTGFAGTGKSTIAHSVAHRFRALNRLGSMFCFDRAKPADRHPRNIFRTIARDLADLVVNWRKLLSPHVKTREARTTDSPVTQFNEFIWAPSQGLTSSKDALIVGTVLIIIDALDECAKWGERSVLIDILSARTADLPSNFRILITSRGEEDIEAAFRDKPHVHQLRTSDITSTDKDVEVFVRNRLQSLSGNAKLDMEDATKWLTRSAEGLFQWANTACRFIQGERGADPAEQLQKLKLAVSRKELLTELDALDKLYSNILFETFSMEKPEVQKRLKTVMGWIVAAREPLSKSSLRELGRLSGADPNGNAVDLIIPSLGSLLSGVDDEHLAVVPLHTSFRDFLQKRYCQDIPHHHRELAIGTLQTMIDGLCFNICQLESSHIPNTAVVGLHERIKNSISIPLSYACRFWADHLDQAKYDAELANKVRSVIMSDRVLYWLEVLSLIGSVPDARRLLNLAFQRLPENDTDQRPFIADAIRFVAVFSGPIARSAPHIYVSALPFTPSASPLSQALLLMSTNRLVITTGQLVDWPAVELAKEGHTRLVKTVAFSRDGMYIASGSYDKTIIVWDAATGEIVAGPLRGHTDDVMSVAFSPNGTYVVSGSRDGTIRVWDVKTGEPTITAGSFSRDQSPILSVAFSPEGTCVVCGLNEDMVHVRNIETSEDKVLFRGHTTSDWRNLVAFSPDGRYIASGSGEGYTIRVWDVATGQALAGAFEEHESWVRAVAFSSDGERLMACSDDATVRIWTLATGEAVVCWSYWPAERARAVAFSWDGRHIVSVASDNTISVGDMEKGTVTAGPIAGGDIKLTSAAISSDGKSVVTGSLGGEIRAWNTDARQTTSTSSYQPIGVTKKVAFSPDGRYIMSKFYDEILNPRMVRVWDAQTGNPTPYPPEGHIDWLLSDIYSLDGRRIQRGFDDWTSIEVLNTETDEFTLGPLKGHAGPVRSFAFSPDGRYIVSGSDDRTIRVWHSTEEQAWSELWQLGPNESQIFRPKSINIGIFGLGNRGWLDPWSSWRTVALGAAVGP